MGELREWWANVHEHAGRAFISRVCETRREAEVAAGEHGGIPNLGYARIHVRLKPEGAPKRYADERERAGWERDPDKARALAKQGIKFEAEPRDCVVPSWLYA